MTLKYEISRAGVFEMSNDNEDHGDLPIGYLLGGRG